MKYAVQPRRDIGIRTIFNLLGPLTNPAMATHQLLGLYSGELTGMVARVLKNLGSACAMVVHGMEGLDEISLCGPTRIAELRGGEVTEYNIEPEQFGLKRSRIEDLHGGNPEECAAILRGVLQGKTGPTRDVVLLNGGAALYVAGSAASINDGIRLAAESIDSGEARRKLDELVRMTNAA
jgi:anthranilate phosphoribosyltransferase